MFHVVESLRATSGTYILAERVQGNPNKQMIKVFATAATSENPEGRHEAGKNNATHGYDAELGNDHGADGHENQDELAVDRFGTELEDEKSTMNKRLRAPSGTYPGGTRLIVVLSVR